MRRLTLLALTTVVACTGPASGPDPTASSTTGPAPAPTTAGSTVPAPFRVLVFHETAGFVHDSIPAGISAITQIGVDRGFEVIATADSAVFTDPGLSEFRSVVFLSTTGDVLTAPEQSSMEGFIRSGKGFVGIHSATDTEYDWPWYGGLVGAYFAGHPEPQTATVRSTGSGHPAAEGLAESWERFDEWYNFSGPPGPGVVVLANLDETTYRGGTMGDPHPIAWAQEYDGGRAFYTGFGHTVETFSEPEFVELLGNAVLWVSGGS